MSNLYFFRDKEGYERKDMFDRVKQDDFTLQNSIISDYVKEYDLDTDDLDNPGKNKLQSFLEDELGTDVYLDLLEELFDEYGENGDTFNIKIYEIGSYVDESALVSEAERLQKEDLMNIEEGDDFSYLLQIENVEDRDEGVVDISFHISGKPDSIPSSEVSWTEEGERKSIDDVTEDTPESLIRDQNYIVEVRIYSDAGLMAVSNSKIDKALQEEIRNGIQRWGSTDGSR